MKKGKKKEKGYRDGLCTSQTAWGGDTFIPAKKGLSANPCKVMTSMCVFYLFFHTS